MNATVCTCCVASHDESICCAAVVLDAGLH